LLIRRLLPHIIVVRVATSPSCVDVAAIVLTTISLGNDGLIIVLISEEYVTLKIKISAVMTNSTRRVQWSAHQNIHMTVFESSDLRVVGADLMDRPIDACGIDHHTHFPSTILSVRHTRFHPQNFQRTTFAILLSASPNASVNNSAVRTR
jgi:hypothetical protein